MPALSESALHQQKLDDLIGTSLALQKLYGRDVQNAATVINLFQKSFAKYPAEKVIQAMEIWQERKPEFPTPSDIIGLIKRGGKEPIPKEIYINISKKDPEHRTGGDWQVMYDYENQMRDDDAVFEDDHKREADLHENLRLREEVHKLTMELERVGNLLHQERNKCASMMEDMENGKIFKKANVQENTIKWMEESGFSAEDIEAYKTLEASKKAAA